MLEIDITRTIRIPDPVRLARYRHCPELGPKPLFFSGGSALRRTSHELIRYTHNSIHIITPFDSGGSSASLREAFHMPAIGDVRNRLLALADRSLHGNPEIFRLFSHRFPADVHPRTLEAELADMIDGRHELVAAIPDPMRKIIRHHLDLFRSFMPYDFDLRKASLGNMILTAGYLDNRRDIDTIIYIFSKLVHVRGVVRPVVNLYRHLVAELADGRVLVGQHELTGKEAQPIDSRVRRLYLSETRVDPAPAAVAIQEKMKDLIAGADLICYPQGSFWSSLVANLLPSGVGAAVARNPCPKVYVPNTAGLDPEAWGMTLADLVTESLRYLRADDPAKIAVADVLDFVILDSRSGAYGELPPPSFWEDLGVRVIDTPLVSPESGPYIDERLLVPVLLSLT